MLNIFKNINLKKGLFYFIIGLLLIPIIQQQTKLIRIGELKGAFTKFESHPLSLKTWLNGSYAKNQEKYLNQNFGFRNLFVRLYNQFQYTIFNEAKANGVIIGKDGYLYEENYILAHLGTDFIGEQKRLGKVKIKSF